LDGRVRGRCTYRSFLIALPSVQAPAGLSLLHLAKLSTGRLPPAKGGSLQHLGAFVVSLIIGILGGLFGNGGRAVRTPLLSLIGYSGFIAVASPLPATIPGTLLASAEYWQSQLLDLEIVWWSIGVGIPATILGSLFTEFTGARSLLLVTGLLVLGFGLSFLLSPKEKESTGASPDQLAENRPAYWHARLVLIASAVGIISGLPANAGGFLFAPAYSRFLKQPIKKSLHARWLFPPCWLCRGRLSMRTSGIYRGPSGDSLRSALFPSLTLAHALRFAPKPGDLNASTGLSSPARSVFLVSCINL
jgi:uncharacterized membrane protein YfcA